MVPIWTQFMIDPYYDVTYVPYSKISQNNNLHYCERS